MLTSLENDAMQLLAYAYLQNARPEKAATLLAAVDAVAPGQPGVLRGLVLAQLRSGQAKQALETLERIELAGGADAAFELARARALTACGHVAEAARAMSACLSLRRAAASPEAPRALEAEA